MGIRILLSVIMLLMPALSIAQGLRFWGGGWLVDESTSEGRAY